MTSLLLLLTLLPSPSLLAPQYSTYPQYPAYPTYYPQSYSSPQTFNYPTYSQTYPNQPPYQQSYSQSYPTYQPIYPTYTRSRQNSLPAYQTSTSTQQQASTKQRASNNQRAYQDPVFNYMLNDLSYFGPEVSRSSRASVPSPKTGGQQTVAWQGKVDGQGATRCHDGTLLPFRARCNKVVQCSEGEDEFDCDWHKRSTVDTVTTVAQFQAILRQNENVLVEFFAPWCPACITFLPHLERLKATSTDLPLKVIKVNTDEDPELKELFSVDTFPRLMLWSKRWGEGPTYMYSQHRTYDKTWGMNYINVNTWIKAQL